MLPMSFKDKDLFYLPSKYNKIYQFRAKKQEYEIFGLICYWGAHYICFFKSDLQNERDSHMLSSSHWVCYDDLNVTKVLTWKDLIVKCLKARFHPTLLFYRKKKEENAKYSYRNNNNEDKALTQEDMKKLLDYSENQDKIIQSLYSKDELRSSRLRPANEGKPQSDDSISSRLKESIDSIRNDYKQNKANNNNIMDIDDSRQFNDINSLNVSNYESNNYNYINNNLDNNNKESIHIKDSDGKNLNYVQSVYNAGCFTDDGNQFEAPHLADNEWLCEKESCRNVNNLESAFCLSKSRFITFRVPNF